MAKIPSARDLANVRPKKGVGKTYGSWSGSAPEHGHLVFNADVDCRPEKRLGGDSPERIGVLIAKHSIQIRFDDDARCIHG
jgi:hypothetical protein